MGEEEQGRVMEIINERDSLRSSGRKLISAMDAMHAGGETFTPRVSLACAELRLLLAPSWPRDGE